MSDVTLSGVAVVRRRRLVLTDVDLQIASGERLCVVGASGSGKTSLLRVIAGLDPPARGWVTVAGNRVEGTRRDVTMVFQTDNVYEHLDVTGNLEFPLRVAGGKQEVDGNVERSARRFSIRGLLGRRPSSLSFGQRRLVSTARALVRPGLSVVLFDEPLVGTDPHRRRRLVESVLGHTDTTVILTTNEPADALRWGDRVAVLAGGRVAQVGPPGEVYEEPMSLEVAELMGDLNRFPGTVRFGDGWAVEIGEAMLDLDPVPLGLADGQRVIAAVRPAHLRLASSGTPFRRTLRATIGRVEVTGARTRLLFGIRRHPGVGFVIDVDGRSPGGVGDSIEVDVPPGRIRLFDPLSGCAL